MTTIVDARGVLCPVPIIRLARTAATLAPGHYVALLTDDPAAEHDVPAWCRLRGHELVAVDPLLDGVHEDEVYGTASRKGHSMRAVHAQEPIAPEPHAPNPAPGHVLRHLIRLGAPADDPGPDSAAAGTASGPSTPRSRSASASSAR